MKNSKKKAITHLGFACVLAVAGLDAVWFFISTMPAVLALAALPAALLALGLTFGLPLIISGLYYLTSEQVDAVFSQDQQQTHSKDPKEKAQFFRTTLTDVFPFIPQVSYYSIQQRRVPLYNV